MKLQNYIRTFLLYLSALVVLMCLALAPANAQSSGKDAGETIDAIKKVTDLFEKGKFAEASVHLEKLVKDDPNNASLRFLYGFALVAKAKDIEDQKESTKVMIQARKELVKAKELGLKEDGLDKLIAILPEDGDAKSGGSLISVPVQTPSLSNAKSAQEYMDKGEMYFAGGDFDNAFLMYQEALKKNPNFYEAALYSGDAMMQKNEFEKAEIWYQKAIAIDPNRETAYRYSATPLMKQRKFDEARLRYVEAYITEPYNSRAMGGLKQWSEATGVEIGHPSIDVPANVNAGADVALAMDNKSDTGEFAWTLYSRTRAAWQPNKDGLSESFKKAYPNETKYRHSLAEEFAALASTVVALKEMMDNAKYKDKKIDPQLKTLIRLYDEGLLESYILFALKDEGIMRDHAEYLKQNREKLRQYVLAYVAAKPAPTTQKGVS